MSKSRERWQQIEAKGMLHFVIVRGVLCWGGIMAVAFVILTYFHWQNLSRAGLFTTQEAQALYLRGLPVAVGISVVAGVAWGIVTWWATRLVWRLQDRRKDVQ